MNLRRETNEKTGFQHTQIFWGHSHCSAIIQGSGSHQSPQTEKTEIHRNHMELVIDRKTNLGNQRCFPVIYGIETGNFNKYIACLGTNFPKPGGEISLGESSFRNLFDIPLPIESMYGIYLPTFTIFHH